MGHNLQCRSVFHIYHQSLFMIYFVRSMRLLSVLAVFCDFTLIAKKKRKSTEKKVFCTLDFLQTHQLIQGRNILKFECAG
jgi:hypothetical protein